MPKTKKTSKQTNERICPILLCIQTSWTEFSFSLSLTVTQEGWNSEPPVWALGPEGTVLADWAYSTCNQLVKLSPNGVSGTHTHGLTGFLTKRVNRLRWFCFGVFFFFFFFFDVYAWFTSDVDKVLILSFFGVELTLRVLCHTIPHRLCGFEVKGNHSWPCFAWTHSEGSWTLLFFLCLQ